MNIIGRGFVVAAVLVLSATAYGQTTATILFDGAEAGIGNGATDFVFSGSVWTGGVVATQAEPSLYASLSRAYHIDEPGGGSVSFIRAVDSISFFYVHGFGFSAGTATVIGPNETVLATFASKAATTFNDPANFVTFNPAVPIKRVEFSAGVIDDFFITKFPAINAELFQGGFSSPIFITAPPGDFGRVFVVEQGGLIKIVENGSVLPTPFLDISPIVLFVGEHGLFSMAFHPEYSTNGLFFVVYSQLGGDTVLARYTVSANPDVADVGSATVFLTQSQPFPNHNAGMIAFKPGDPNHHLYMGLGDGGSGGDPGNRAQDLSTLLGKILRIDVDQGPPAAAPPSNPFVAQAGLDLIWAYGLRNPWRFSFDRDTGDLYIGDVGQGLIEEVDFEPSTSQGGVNYGWRLLEGSDDFNCVDCDGARATTSLPIHQYPHSGNQFSVIGGYVYRGRGIAALFGHYFFGDLEGPVWSFRFDGNSISSFLQRGSSFIPQNLTIFSFGEDAAGELYIVDGGGGDIYKVMDPAASPEATLTSGPGIVEEGQRAVLSVSVFGVSPPLSFQWTKDSVDLVVDASIADVNSQTLIIDPVRSTDEGTYRLRFADQGTPTKSGPFTGPPIGLQVVAPGSLPVAGILALAVVGVACVLAGAWVLRKRRVAQP